MNYGINYGSITIPRLIGMNIILQNINLKTSYRSNDTNMNKILNTIRRGKLLKPNMIN